MTGKARRMGAALPGYISKDNGANPNMIQFGDKLQGLPPLTGRRDPYRVYKTKAGGNAPDRFRIFCINQLGGIGMRNKNSQFAPNADGLGWCPNRKNRRYNKSHGKRDIGDGDDDDDSPTNRCDPSSYAGNSALTQYITGMYLDTIWSLITDSSAIIPSNQTINPPPGVRCDGWLCGAPDVDCGTDSCCNAQRMSWFQLNTDKPRDFYIGFDQTNYISSTLTVSQQNAFRDTMTFLGNKDDTHIWWVFGGSDGGQPGPTSQVIAPPPSDGGDNDVVTIIQANNLALNIIGLSAIYGVNFDIEPGTELTQNITNDPNYLINIIEKLGKMYPHPVTDIQITILPDLQREYQNADDLLQNIITTISHQQKNGVNFRLQFMPYANDSIMSNCGSWLGCNKTPDTCACYVANLLMRGSQSCPPSCTGSPLTPPASQSDIKTWADLALYFKLPFFGAISLNLKTAHTGLQGGDTDQQQIIKKEEELLHKIYDILKSVYDGLIIGKSPDKSDYTYDVWYEQSGHMNKPDL